MSEPKNKKKKSSKPKAEETETVTPETEEAEVEAETPEVEAEAKAELEAEEVKETKEAPTADDSQAVAAEKEKYLRLLAEYDNFRRRTAKEKEQIYADVRGETVKKFFPVFDSLTRALSQTPEDDPARKGLEMIMTQFETALKGLNVTVIEAVGQPFDANLHNAVMHVEDEEFGENAVVEEFEKGFKIGDKVLRYSAVKVAN